MPDNKSTTLKWDSVPATAVRPPEPREGSHGFTFLVSGGQLRPTDPRVPSKVRPFDRTLLLLAGDIERNPGPDTPHQTQTCHSTHVLKPRGKPQPPSNIVGCDSCGNAIRRPRSGLTNWLTCAEPSCSAPCHKSSRCSGLSRYQLHKDWWCRLHSPHPTPSCHQPVHQDLQRDSCLCDSCNTRIRKGAARLYCSAANCKAQSHKGKKCSGLNRDRQEECARLGGWNCRAHDLSRAGSHPPVQPPTHPASPPFGDYLIPFPRPEKTKCRACMRTIRSTNLPATCEDCGEFYHKGCTGLRKSAANEVAAKTLRWSCGKCSTVRGDYVTLARGASSKETSARGGSGTPAGSLKIFQWNADGIIAKAKELELRLAAGGYDLAFIQETKLTARDPTPKIPGYAALRCDRKSRERGGGLLCLIKEGIIFARIANSSKDGTEVASIRIRISRRKWVRVNHVYCPPSRSHTRTVRLCFDNITPSPDSITLGDFNAHNALWDYFQPEDERGDRLLDWILEHSLSVLNDGSPTRTNRAGGSDSTGGRSTPDLTLCGTTWCSRTTWQTLAPIGSSDHVPIETVINARVEKDTRFQGVARWRTKDADWSAFTEEVENSTTCLPPRASIKEMADALNSSITSAARKILGKAKPGRRRKSWETPEVRKAIKDRNRLRPLIKTHRREWVEACRAAQAAINQAKTDAWRRTLEGATDDRTLWRVIRSLKGSPDTNSPHEAMSHNGRLITSNRRKADIFAVHYAGISKLVMDVEGRRENRQLKSTLRSLRQQPPPTPPITMHELQSAIAKMKERGAAGPDGISPPLLKHLGPKAMLALLTLFNFSFETGAVPQIWRNATIVPLLKAGKPPSELGSYRPISLTSCVGKLLERVVSERLYTIAEGEGLFSCRQAGFRKGRGAEDQVLRISQAVADGFQKSERSVLALLDFSKAYDTVWRQRLLRTLARRGIPAKYVLWLSAFLTNRQARVRFHGTLGKSRTLHQGLPQGSVLAPILFLFYIDELARLIPDSVTAALYADDVSILASARTLRRAESLTQQAVDRVVGWSREWRLSLNTMKSEVSFFSLSTAEAKWRPSVKIGDNEIPFNPEPKFLGVTLDRSLSFGPHVKNIKGKATSKLSILGAVANTTWGWRKADLKKILQAHVCSVLHYASDGWQPWLRPSNVQRLETIYNRGLRLVTGQGAASPVEALRAEAGVSSLQTQIWRNCVRSREKALRLPADHPRHVAFSSATEVRRRLSKRRDARSVAEELSASIPHLEDGKRAPLTYFETPPWLSGLSGPEVHHALPGIASRGDEHQAIQEAALICCLEIAADYNIYTDGSATGGTLNGGAAVVVTKGDPRDPEVITTIMARGARFTSSFEEEKHAMELAINWIAIHLRPHESAAVFTDSQSLCVALASFSPGTEGIRGLMVDLVPKITIQWIPGHCEIPGNEMADRAAKDATTSAGMERGTSFGGICAQIRARITDPPIQHQRTAVVYSALNPGKEAAIITSRSDQTLLAQLRSGKFPGLRAFKHTLDPSVDPTCPQCGLAPQDLEHWVAHCPATAVQRRNLFGPEGGGLDCLSRFPAEVVALARSTLLGA